MYTYILGIPKIPNNLLGVKCFEFTEKYVFIKFLKDIQQNTSYGYAIFFIYLTSF